MKIKFTYFCPPFAKLIAHKNKIKPIIWIMTLRHVCFVCNILI